MDDIIGQDFWFWFLTIIYSWRDRSIEYRLLQVSPSIVSMDCGGRLEEMRCN